MARKILSDLISGLRNGIAWGLAVSPHSRLTLWLLEPLAAKPTPRPLSLPPCSGVVARPEKKRATAVVRDGAASLLFLLWHWDMRIRTELHEWKHAIRVGVAWGQIYTGWRL